MTIWVTSDTHFNNENIILYNNRTFADVQEMNSSLMDRWNSNVKPLDFVYHLGSFGAGTVDDLMNILCHLNGYVTLIRSNSDIDLQSSTKSGFTCVANELVLQYKSWEFKMTHQPRCDLIYDENNHGLINLHGNTNSRNRVVKNRINVSTDAWDFTPITLDDVLMEYRKKRK